MQNEHYRPLYHIYFTTLTLKKHHSAQAIAVLVHLHLDPFTLTWNQNLSIKCTLVSSLLLGHQNEIVIWLRVVPNRTHALQASQASQGFDQKNHHFHDTAVTDNAHHRSPFLSIILVPCGSSIELKGIKWQPFLWEVQQIRFSYVQLKLQRQRY